MSMFGHADLRKAKTYLKFNSCPKYSYLLWSKHALYDIMKFHYKTQRPLHDRRALRLAPQRPTQVKCNAF